MYDTYEVTFIEHPGFTAELTEIFFPGSPEPWQRRLYMTYTKGDIENVPAAQLKTIRNEIQRIKKAFGEED